MGFLMRELRVLAFSGADTGEMAEGRRPRKGGGKVWKAQKQTRWQ